MPRWHMVGPACLPAEAVAAMEGTAAQAVATEGEACEDGRWSLSLVVVVVVLAVVVVVLLRVVLVVLVVVGGGRRRWSS